MTKVWEMELPAKDKLLLLALADWASDEGLAWPSIATLSRKCGCDERTVQRNLRKLEEAGHLRREEVPGKGCRYWVLTPGKSTGDKMTGGKLSPVTKTTNTPGKLPPNTSRNPINGLSNDKPKRAGKAAAGVEVPDWVPAEAWGAFLEMRRANRKAPTARAAALLIAQLDRWRGEGHDPAAILNQSTMNNWTGLYEPKDNKFTFLPTPAEVRKIALGYAQARRHAKSRAAWLVRYTEMQNRPVERGLERSERIVLAQRQEAA